ncbi:MAG: PAS domain-containing protein [Spirochaetales bacterium]|nr:PAS domain-containing protein [Spirochaetales bacterium]
MRRGSLAGRVGAALALAAFAGVAAFGALSFAVARSVYADSNRFALAESARALANLASEAFAEPASAGAWAARAASGSGFRLTLVAADGAVIAETRADAAAMENHADRPEVAQALAGGPGWATRRSATTGVETLYAAAPVPREGKPVGALRLSFAAPELQARLMPFVLAFLAAAALSGAAWALAARAVGKALVAPVAQLAAAAGDWAAGRLTRRAGRAGIPELDALAGALDQMAAELDARMRESESRGRELLSILDGMGEAVLAVDAALKVRRLNPAARKLLLPGSGTDSAGRSLLETLGSTDLAELAASCVGSARPLEGELQLYRGERRHFLVYAAPLGAPDGPVEGAVLVLNDITRLRALEQVRTDFVANVSHELRTPIQLVKGFTEALCDGAVDEPTEARRFLGIVSRHAARLEAIIDDLLSLARLEQSSGSSLGIERTRVLSPVADAIAALDSRSPGSGARVSLVCPEDLEADMNPGLLEQAALNLVDNALKYAPQGTLVELSVRDEGGLLAIEVADRGPGIPPGDAERIFERFYRLDKGRSRESGGTGLGLAIVRHIALAHGGTVSVRPRAGGGSVFRLEFPLRIKDEEDRGGTDEVACAERGH